MHDEPANWARWRLAFDRAGSYRVEVNVVPAYAGSRRAPYRVRHSGRETPLQIDLSGGGAWVTLGDFNFAAGQDQWVAVYDNSGEDRDLERRIMADAVRITPAQPPAPDPDAFVPPAPRDAGSVWPPDARPAWPDARPGWPDAFVPRRDAGASWRDAAHDRPEPQPGSDRAPMIPPTRDVSPWIPPATRDAGAPWDAMVYHDGFSAPGESPTRSVRFQGNGCGIASDGHAAPLLLLLLPLLIATRWRSRTPRRSSS